MLFLGTLSITILSSSLAYNNETIQTFQQITSSVRIVQNTMYVCMYVFKYIYSISTILTDDDICICVEMSVLCHFYMLVIKIKK